MLVESDWCLGWLACWVRSFFDQKWVGVFGLLGLGKLALLWCALRRE